MVLLPSSPLSICQDRFSLTNSEDSHVYSWSILLAVLPNLPKSTSALIEQLDVIAVTFRGTSNTDFGYLRHFLDEVWPTPLFLTQVWPSVVKLALEMPSLFPDGRLPKLTPSHPQRQFSRRHIACLVVHQFMCTLSAPDWLQSDGSPDFHIWYGSEPPHRKAVHAYLYATFTYFYRIAAQPSIIDIPIDDWPITLTLRSSASLPDSPSSLLAPFTIRQVACATTDPCFLGLPDGACVISANRHIGFGRTGTQEETHVGCSPEACPAVLLTPPLADDQVLVVEGPEAMISMEGYSREAHFVQVLADSKPEPPNISPWRKRTMLFMDALELDRHDATSASPECFVPDLLPGHLDRELVKAHTAFSSRSYPYREVATGLWGCGAFGGNKEIKTIVQWCAASIANVPIAFVCSEEKEFLDGLREFVKLAERERWRVHDVLKLLRRLGPADQDGVSAFRYISRQLTTVKT